MCALKCSAVLAGVCARRRSRCCSHRDGTHSLQSAGVAAYLASPNVPNRSLFNASGRGFPDMAAQAVNFVIVSDRIPDPGVAGASASRSGSSLLKPDVSSSARSLAP